MFNKAIAAAILATTSFAGIAHAADNGHTLGAGFVQTETDGVDGEGFYLDTSSSTKFDSGTVWQSDISVGTTDVEGFETNTFTGAVHLGKDIGDGVTVGAYAGRTIFDTPQETYGLTKYGVEGKYEVDDINIEAGLGLGKQEFGDGMELNIHTAHLGGRYGLETSFGELGLGGAFDLVKDDESDVSYEAKSYMLTVDYMATENVELKAGFGIQETSLNGFDNESDVIQVGAEYKFGGGSHWNHGAF